MTRRALLLLACLGACRGASAREEQGVIAGDGPRLVVEVLNGTGIRGLARTGTRLLRERGMDVVGYGNAEAEVESTRVLVRRGNVEQGVRVVRALGVGRAELALDSLRRVDVTVVLGRDYPVPADIRP
jgi:hypothetical protein